MKRRTIVIIVLIAVAAIAVGCVTTAHTFRTSTLKRQAGQLLEDGSYEQAKLIYSILEDTDSAALCDSLIQERSYQQGLQLMNQGSFDDALDCFVSLGDYQDAQTMAELCDWQEILSVGTADSLIELYSFYSSLSSSAGTEQILEQICAALYDIAVEDARDFNLTQACEIWTALGNYKDSETLLWRGQRAVQWAAADTDKRLLSDSYLYMSREKFKVYLYKDEAYVVVPNRLDSDANYFIYYPGGRNEELYIDYLYYYLMDPTPDTIAVFLIRNGLSDIESKTYQAIDLLEQIAAEKRLFVQNISTVGSSLGAYPAMHTPVYAYEKYGIITDCVLSLDAGSDWAETWLLLSQDECQTTAQLGTDFYLFESIGVGMNRAGIRQMVNAGISVTMVGCIYDDHVQISLDALGMGVMDWVFTDRSENCNPDWYQFLVLEPET